MWFGNSFSLGRYWGIDLRVDYSWFIIFFLIVSSLSMGFLPQFYPQLSDVEYAVLGMVLGVLFFLSVVVHEFAHALYAKARGIRIDRMVFFLFGGAAEIKDDSPSPRVEFIMAGLGPLVSYGIAALFGLVWLIGVSSGLVYIEIAGLTLAAVNAVVATFNMIPAFPLDGGRMLRAVIWKVHGNLERSTRYSSLIGRVFAGLLVAYGIFLLLSGLIINGIWLVMLGIFLNAASMQGYMMTRLQAYRNTAVAEIMQPVTLLEPREPDVDIEGSVLDALEAIQQRDVLYVGDGDGIVGIVTRRQLQAIVDGVRPKV